jgi:hypothetical protein
MGLGGGGRCPNVATPVGLAAVAGETGDEFGF